MTLRWTLRGQTPVDVWVYRDEKLYARMVLPPDEPQVAYAEVDGKGWRIAWTPQPFYRIAEASSGTFVGEARHLPWKPTTFRAMLRGLRSYRWDAETSVWMRDERPFITFEGDRVYAPDEADDAAPLLALGLLLIVNAGDPPETVRRARA